MKVGPTIGTTPAGATPFPVSPSRFAPGAIVAYRCLKHPLQCELLDVRAVALVALLGRGGMGEVYRADDLTLDPGESVAVPVARALAMLAGFFLVLVLGVVAGSRGSVISQLPMAIPRNALADRANRMLTTLGYVVVDADDRVAPHVDRSCVARVLGRPGGSAVVGTAARGLNHNPQTYAG